MSMRTNVIALVGVAGVAFGVGMSVDSVQTVLPAARAAQPEQPMELSPEMQKRIQMGMPGKFHTYLEPLVGEWTATVEFRENPTDPFMSSTGTVSRRWVLDGRFVREDVEAETEWGAFRGLGYIGYNNFDQQYEMVWLENMSTAMYTERMTFDPARKIMSGFGTYRDPATGRLVPTRGELNMSNPDRHTYVGWSATADGKWFESFRGTFERKSMGGNR